MPAKDPSDAIGKSEPLERITFAESLSRFADALEADRPDDAARLVFGGSAEVKVQIRKFWANLQAANRQYAYRSWAVRFKAAGEPETFTVGGHDYSHMHVVWKKTEQGRYRISKVWMCR